LNATQAIALPLEAMVPVEKIPPSLERRNFQLNYI
jgi:hypothetical protein